MQLHLFIGNYFEVERFYKSPYLLIEEDGILKKRLVFTYTHLFSLELPKISVLCSMAEDILINWKKKSGEHQKQYKQFLQKADKNTVLKKLPDLHEEAFEKIDCLQCANCCKSYSPRFKTPDVKRISRHLKMRESEFIDAYLRVDEDGDYVAKSTPCPFLGADNYCGIYDQRPSDCHRFPYTDEDVLIKRQQLTLKNSTFCPITYYVLEKLMKSNP